MNHSNQKPSTKNDAASPFTRNSFPAVLATQPKVNQGSK